MDAADVDADDEANDDEGAAAEGEGGDALGPRAQARARICIYICSLDCAWGAVVPLRLACLRRARWVSASLPPGAPSINQPQIINTACWQSSKECGLLLGALARALPIGGEFAIYRDRERVCHS